MSFEPVALLITSKRPSRDFCIAASEFSRSERIVSLVSVKALLAAKIVFESVVVEVLICVIAEFALVFTVCKLSFNVFSWFNIVSAVESEFAIKSLAFIASSALFSAVPL